MKELFYLCMGTLLLSFIIIDGRRAFSRKPLRTIKLDEFEDRPLQTWTRRNPLNPIDTDF